MNKGVGIYPEIDEKDFYKKITHKKEFWDNRPSNIKKFDISLLNHQQLLSNFINPLTQYNSLLVYHKVGLGKTRVAISIAENFKNIKNIYIVLKNDIIEMNFINEILNSDYRDGYLDKSYYTETDAIEKNKLHKDAVKKIKKMYEFITFGNIVSKNFKKIPSNSLIIVDEAHNLTGEGGTYNSFIKSMNSIKNTKIVLLTATPVYDSITEIFQLSNILNSVDKNYIPFPNSTKLETQGYIKTKDKGDNKLLVKTPFFLTQKGKDAIKSSFIGKVSYLETNEENFAKRIFNGTLIDKNTKGGIKITRCIMSSFQDNAYSKTFNTGSNTLFKNQSDASTIVYPGSVVGTKGFIKNKNDTSYLKMENIKKYSSKFYKMLQNIKTSNGPVFIYSNYVTNGGTELVKNLLLRNGYTTYTNTVQNKPTVLLFNANMSVSKRKKNLEIFNSNENVNGGIIKVIIGSPVISEGISLKNIKQIHILEPHWNLSRIDQVIGRGIRFGSHLLLPKSDRFVDIFLYAAVSPSSVSIDIMKYNLSHNKDLAIREIEHIMKKIAIDCFINKSQNIKDTDHSRQCQYTKCNYTCNYEAKDVIIDKSSYVLKIHDKSKYNYIKNRIKGLFKQGYVFKLEQIVNFVKIKAQDIEDKNIYIVIKEMVNSRCNVLNKDNKKSTIKNINGYFIPVSCENKKDATQLFDTIFHKEIDVKSLHKILGIKKEVKKKIKGPNIKFSIDKRGIFGTLKGKDGKQDDIFRIIDNRWVNNADKRKVPVGRVCASLSKGELLDIMKYLGIKSTKNTTKNYMCNYIYNKFIDNKLFL